MCSALEPPEKTGNNLPFSVYHVGFNGAAHFHMAPEIFVSEGSPGSIVDNWVKKHGSSIHHMAYEVPDVEAQRKLWIEKGWAEFTSDKAFSCGELTQIFTKPNKYSGIIYEFIERKGQHGFCKESVKSLMLSSVELDKNIK